MTLGDILIIIAVIVVLIVAGLYFLNRYVYKKMNQQQQLIEQNKQTVSIFVIDKKRDKLKNANLPHAVLASMPKIYINRKTYLVKAKVGAQILTLMSDKNVFELLQANRTVKVDIAGFYIVAIKGVKANPDKNEKTKKINPLSAFLKKDKK